MSLERICVLSPGLKRNSLDYNIDIVPTCKQTISASTPSKAKTYGSCPDCQFF